MKDSNISVVNLIDSVKRGNNKRLTCSKVDIHKGVVYIYVEMDSNPVIVTTETYNKIKNHLTVS